MPNICGQHRRGANIGGRDLRPRFLLPAPDLALDAPRTLSKFPPAPPISPVLARVRRALVPYHACMHHGPANKLHRVATLLPLSLSCQVEPLKHSPPPTPRRTPTPLRSPHTPPRHPSLRLLPCLLVIGSLPLLTPLRSSGAEEAIALSFAITPPAPLPPPP